MTGFTPASRGINRHRDVAPQLSSMQAQGGDMRQCKDTSKEELKGLQFTLLVDLQILIQYKLQEFSLQLADTLLSDAAAGNRCCCVAWTGFFSNDKLHCLTLCATLKSRENQALASLFEYTPTTVSILHCSCYVCSNHCQSTQPNHSRC